MQVSRINCLDAKLKFTLFIDLASFKVSNCFLKSALETFVAVCGMAKYPDLKKIIQLGRTVAVFSYIINVMLLFEFYG